MKKKKGFTLAEILIVLGVIGLVAEMTIPTLSKNMQEKEAIVGIKKTYSMLSQSYTMVVQENGVPSSWDVTGTPAQVAEQIINIFKPYLKRRVFCGVNMGCFPDVAYKYLNRAYDFDNLNRRNDFAKIQLSDGTSFGYVGGGVSCNSVVGTTTALQKVCGVFWADINGHKGPNTVAKDLFMFYLTDEGIIPTGTINDTSIWGFDGSSGQCKINQQTDGWGCTAWLIYNENMDYLKCSDLSWNGKKKCQ